MTRAGEERIFPRSRESRRGADYVAWDRLGMIQERESSFISG
jgi:hypothetical protein